MRKKLYAANWKMNLGKREIAFFLKELNDLFSSGSAGMFSSEYVFFPQTALLSYVKELFPASLSQKREEKGLKLSWGIQNMHWEEEGAYTGENSPLLAKEFSCSYVLAGHSERRQFFGETSVMAAQRVVAAQKHSMKAILCMGETLEERESGRTLEVLAEQFRAVLSFSVQPEALVLAYEPVWAIGTGKTATVEEAESAQAFLREEARKSWGEKAFQLRILYGGSVKPENSLSFLSSENIDGVLVGGASLVAKSFFRIAESSLEC